MPKPKVKVPSVSQEHSDLPTLGVISALHVGFAYLPRMQWMSDLLDRLESNQEILTDPLRALPPSARDLLLELPHIAWITIALYIVNFMIMLTIVALSEFGFIYKWFATILLTFTMFVMFTVAHDAAHGSISNIKWINGLIGRLAFGTMGPAGSFPLFRYIHQMHHKFTNDKNKDPDTFCAHGGYLLLPIRCLLLAPSYLVFYAKHIHTRSYIEILEVITCFSIQIGLIWGGIERGYGFSLLNYWLVPSVIAYALLAFFFDFIPHHHQSATTPLQSRYHTTSILQTYWFAQPFLSLLLQYQDYHLVHHLYPTIPFYRYADKWIEKQDFLMEKQISISHLTVEEVVKNAKEVVESTKQTVQSHIKVH